VFHSKRQQEDDKKAIERGKNELLRLEKQLEVSCAEFTKLQILNQELLQHLEELNARTGSEEYKQKMTIESLQKKIRKDDDTNRSLEVQEKEKGETYRKLLMEVEAMTEKLKSSIQRDTATQEALDEEVCI
jgi:choline kinase